MLLSKGDIAYFGPSNQMVNFFGNLGFVLPKYSSPTDFASIVFIFLRPYFQWMLLL